MNNVAEWEGLAVQAAMNGAWEQAVTHNQQIIKEDKDNIAAHNRLARAFWELNRLNDAKKSYQRVLSLDPYNQIATKNLERLKDQVKKAPKNQSPLKTTDGTIFLEEPGKTKLVKLVKIASPETLVHYDSGDEISLTPKNFKISVIGKENTYLGSIPDDLSHYLLKLIKAGNQYSAHIKSVNRQNLEIFIREIKRGPDYQKLPSFGVTYKKTS